MPIAKECTFIREHRLNGNSMYLATKGKGKFDISVIEIPWSVQVQILTSYQLCDCGQLKKNFSNLSCLGFKWGSKISTS